MKLHSLGITLHRCALFGALTVSMLATQVHGAEVDADKALASSVVKIYSTRLNPDLNKPWNRQSPSSVSGSGVVIEGNRILTNAHVALYASQIQV